MKPYVVIGSGFGGLSSARVSSDDVANGTADATAIASVCKGIVAVSDRYYAPARERLRFLPPRGRIAVTVAASLYQAIGHAVVRGGVEALNQRTVLSRFSLSVAFVRGLLTLMRPTVRSGVRRRDSTSALGPAESGHPCPTA